MYNALLQENDYKSREIKRLKKLLKSKQVEIREKHETIKAQQVTIASQTQTRNKIGKSNGFCCC